jgi:hypothetical protein
MRTRVLFLVLLLCTAAPASPQQVEIAFDAGRVTIHAVNAPLAAILAEWARQGGTRIVGAEALEGRPLTLDLEAVPERQAIETLLTEMAGYVLALRSVEGGGPVSAGRSETARIHVLTVSKVVPSATPKRSAEVIERVPVDARRPSAGFRLTRAPDTEPAESALDASPDRLTEPDPSRASAAAAGEQPMRLREPRAAPLVDPGTAMGPPRLETPQPARPPR